MSARATFTLTCCFVIAAATQLRSQQPLTPPAGTRVIHVLVTTQQGKLVTGLAEEHFSVLRNGVPQPIQSFDFGSPMTVAIVGLTGARPELREDEMIRANSLEEALRALAATTNMRKALIVPEGTDTAAVPAGVHVVASDEARLWRSVLEVRNAYTLAIAGPDPSMPVQVTLVRQQGLPPLQLNWQ